MIRDKRDFQHHLDYIDYNPAKHGYVPAAKDWPYSSFPRWVARGVYPIDWAASSEVAEWSWE